MSAVKRVAHKSSYAVITGSVLKNDATACDFHEVSVDSENLRVLQYKSRDVYELYSRNTLYKDIIIINEYSLGELLFTVQKNDSTVRNFQKIYVKSKKSRIVKSNRIVRPSRIVQPSSRKHQFSRK